MSARDLFNGILADHAAAMAYASAAPMKMTYRGWTIHPCEWSGWRAYGPNYDASYEGPEDGWVDNGEKAEAPTREALIAEIDDWFEEHPDAAAISRAQGGE